MKKIEYVKKNEELVNTICEMVEDFEDGVLDNFLTKYKEDYFGNYSSYSDNFMHAMSYYSGYKNTNNFITGLTYELSYYVNDLSDILLQDLKEDYSTLKNLLKEIKKNFLK